MADNMIGNGESHVFKIAPLTYNHVTEKPTAASAAATATVFRKTPTTLFRNFLDYTSSHGFAHINRMESPVGKVIWAVLTLAGLGVAMYQAHKVINQYLKYEYNTLMDIRFDANVTFPAVTICNLNPYRLSQLDALALLDADLSRKYHMFSGGNDSFNNGNKFDELDDLLQAVNQLSANNRSMLGHQLEDMLIQCSYGSKECDAKNFTSSYNYALGNCYSFNELARHITSRAGSRYGLKLLLFTEIHEYIPNLAGSTGFKIVVHDQNQVPFPEEEGFHISAGFKTQIGVRRFEMRRLGAPYYECHPSSTAGNLNHYHKQFPNSYSRSVCIRSCYQNDLIAKCGCYIDDIPKPENMNSSVEACSINDTRESCANNLYDQYFADTALDIDQVCPDCYPVCTEVKYYGTYSQSMIPVPEEVYVEKFLESLTRESKSFKRWFDDLKTKQYTRATLDQKARYALAEVHIFLDELNYEYVYQRAASTPTDVISNLGGQLGLWIGMSLLSVFEYFELLGSLCLLGGRRLSNREMSRKTKDVESPRPRYS